MIDIGKEGEIPESCRYLLHTLNFCIIQCQEIFTHIAVKKYTLM